MKDFYVLPSRFRKCLAAKSDHPAESHELLALQGLGYIGTRIQVKNSLLLLVTTLFKVSSHPVFGHLHNAVEGYLFEGGFPEVWSLPTLLAKQEYLYQNQIEYVILKTCW